MNTIKIACRQCAKRFSGAETKVLLIKACPKCKHTGDWWIVLERQDPVDSKPVDDDPTPLAPLDPVPATPLAPAPQRVSVRQPPNAPARDTSINSSSSKVPIAAIGAAGVCLLIAVGITAYLIGASGSPNSHVQLDEPVDQCSGNPDLLGPDVESTSENLHPSKEELRLDELRNEAGQLARGSVRFNTQATRTAKVIDGNPTHAELSDEVTELRREYDAMEALLSRELRDHVYVTKLGEYLEYLELAVENFRLSIDFQIQANTGRFTIQEAKALLERADNCRAQVFTCIELGSDSMKEATAELTKLSDAITDLEKQVSEQRRRR